VLDALRLHDEIKESGGSLEPKAAITLIVSKSVNHLSRWNEKICIVVYNYLLSPFLIELYFLLQEHIRTEGELDRMHQLLDGLNDSNSWFEGCGRVLLYCVQHNYTEYDCQCLCSCLSTLFSQTLKLTTVCLFAVFFSFLASVAIDLLKQLKEKDEMSTYMVVDQVFFFDNDLVGHQDT